MAAKADFSPLGPSGELDSFLVACLAFASPDYSLAVGR